MMIGFLRSVQSLDDVNGDLKLLSTAVDRLLLAGADEQDSHVDDLLDLVKMNPQVAGLMRNFIKISVFKSNSASSSSSSPLGFLDKVRVGTVLALDEEVALALERRGEAMLSQARQQDIAASGNVESLYVVKQCLLESLMLYEKIDDAAAKERIQPMLDNVQARIESATMLLY